MSISSISLSGLRAAQSALDVAAGNVAKLETPGYRRRVVVQSDTPEGGTRVTTAAAAAPGSDLAADLVGALQARDAFAANLAVFRGGERLLGWLVDTRS
jgi:flagellar basal body rod protein FlgC